MLWFIDDNGLVQLTGVGVVLFLPLLIMLLFGLYRLVKDITFFVKDYQRLKNAEASFDEAFISYKLEEYYQKRKAWEKRKGFW